MANPEHLAILEMGVEEWNRARQNLASLPHLDGADLRGADLIGADLHGARLTTADLRGAKLSNVNLRAASLREAQLDGADLMGADLIGADLRQASFRGADLRGAMLGPPLVVLKTRALDSAMVFLARKEREAGGGGRIDGADFAQARLGDTLFGELDLSRAKGLAKALHSGPSLLTTRCLVQSVGRLPEVFLRGCGLSDWEILATRLYGKPMEPDDVGKLVRAIESFAGGHGRFFSAFISYSHSDKSFACRLHDQLQGQGIRCWLDVRKVLPGTKIADAVTEAIRYHDKVLLCCSESSLTSSWVEDEISAAIEKERRSKRSVLIPLNLDDYLSGWSGGHGPRIRGRLAADFTGWEKDNAKFEEQFERVVEALRAERAGQGA